MLKIIINIMARNRAFEDENGETPERRSSEINTISKKVFPHNLDGGHISKIVSCNFVKFYPFYWFIKQFFRLTNSTESI